MTFCQYIHKLVRISQLVGDLNIDFECQVLVGCLGSRPKPKRPDWVPFTKNLPLQMGGFGLPLFLIPVPGLFLISDGFGICPKFLSGD